MKINLRDMDKWTKEEKPQPKKKPKKIKKNNEKNN
jgi:hypothetical protein